MRTMKNFAAAALVMLLCTVVFGAMFTSCTNSEDGMPTFTASQKTIKVPVEVRDTVWYPVHDTLTIEVIKKEGIKADGNPDLYFKDEEHYTSYYPIIEDGISKEVRTDLNVRASILSWFLTALSELRVSQLPEPLVLTKAETSLKWSLAQVGTTTLAVSQKPSIPCMRKHGIRVGR